MLLGASKLDRRAWETGRACLEAYTHSTQVLTVYGQLALCRSGDSPGGVFQAWGLACVPLPRSNIRLSAPDSGSIAGMRDLPQSQGRRKPTPSIEPRRSPPPDGRLADILMGSGASRRAHGSTR
jgi:hypothetical protein